MKPILSAALIALAFAGVSCTPKSGAKEFLAWSMEQHKDLKSYSSTAEYSVTGGVFSGNESTRTVSYQSPNLFKIVSARKGGLTMTSISDGDKLVDYASDGEGNSYDAPATLADASSMQIQLPMANGSLLYKFFGGQDALDKLANESKGPITEAGEEDLPGGGKGKLIKFFATGAYGNATALIDEKTGMVHRITYDSATLLENIKKMGGPEGEAKPFTSTEKYSDIKINPTIEASLFKAALPEGISVDKEVASNVFSSGPERPIPIGKPAPDFTVVTLEGKEVKLSSLRGKPVFIDFWATWCPPCRASLPHTQKVAANFGDKITVLAISDEDKDTIAQFQKHNNYTYPSYRDPDNVASQLYKVEGIPTFVVIDEKGIVVDYQSGYSSDEPLDRALAKVGIKV